MLARRAHDQLALVDRAALCYVRLDESRLDNRLAHMLGRVTIVISWPLCRCDYLDRRLTFVQDFTRMSLPA